VGHPDPDIQAITPTPVRRTPASTRIKLLVDIFILAILTVFLFPVFAPTRARARQIPSQVHFRLGAELPRPAPLAATRISFRAGVPSPAMIPPRAGDAAGAPGARCPAKLGGARSSQRRGLSRRKRMD
jgi:hypothetical protein